MAVVPPVPPLRKRLKRLVRALALQAGAAVLALLPVRWASGLGALLGSVGWHLARTDRARALDSLAVAFPTLDEPARIALGRACFRHLSRSTFELVCVRQIDRHVDEWIDWSPADRHVLDAALARKRGVIFVSGHVGSWELLARRVALAGYPCQTIARETTDPRTTALIERFRASANLKAIWRGRPGAAKEMLRALKRGEILGLLIDQDTAVQSVFVPFFGRLAKTPRAAADLAVRTGAAVVLGFCQRVAPHRYRLTMRELPVPSGDREPVVTQLTAELTRGIEGAVRAAPEQWVWMHRRWRSRPEPQAPSTGALEPLDSAEV